MKVYELSDKADYNKMILSNILADTRRTPRAIRKGIEASMIYRLW